MIQRGKGKWHIISRDMTLEAVPLQLLSNFPAQPSLQDKMSRRHNGRVHTGNVRKPKWPIVYPPPNYPNLSQSVETTADSWPEPMEQKTGTGKKKCLPSVNFIGSLYFLIYEDLDVECYVYLIYFVYFQWRSSMHQIHLPSDWPLIIFRCYTTFGSILHALILV